MKILGLLLIRTTTYSLRKFSGFSMIVTRRTKVTKLRDIAHIPALIQDCVWCLLCNPNFRLPPSYFDCLGGNCQTWSFTLLINPSKWIACFQSTYSTAKTFSFLWHKIVMSKKEKRMPTQSFPKNFFVALSDNLSTRNCSTETLCRNRIFLMFADARSLIELLVIVHHCLNWRIN